MSFLINTIHLDFYDFRDQYTVEGNAWFINYWRNFRRLHLSTLINEALPYVFYPIS